MDRETRKANLKKLQLPSTTGDRQKRKTRQSATSIVTDTAITNYFLTPERHNKIEATRLSVNSLSPVASELNKHCEDAPQASDIHLKAVAPKRAKRTKLDAFLFKDPNNIPVNVKNIKKSINDNDFIFPEKKARKAPTLITTRRQAQNSKSLRTKKQTTIKSAFLRNEQLFAEIAAQHCAADQFDGDDVQLALAISKSEAESKGVGIVNENLNDDFNLVDNEAESIREKLKKYGFRTAEKKDYNTFAAAFLPKINSRKPKSKWANKFTALTLRSSENQVKKLEESIGKLLNNQFRTKPLRELEKYAPVYELQSSLLKKSEAHETKRVLQVPENENQPIELYFVKDLFEISALPAGHLLKDWTAIQGRDLTPNPRNKLTAARIKILEIIYQDLEELFSSRKRLDWTTNSGQENDQQVLTNNEERQIEDSPEVVKDNPNLYKIAQKDKVELDRIIDFKEVVQRLEETNIENTKSNHSGLACKNKILQLLPSPKSLDKMQVSSSSISTQATINTTQQNRSNSPDLFADSDVESDRSEEGDKTEVEIVSNSAKDKKSATPLGDMEANIITYEIFSSDEVKNTLLSELNKSTSKELSPKNSPHVSDEKIIDLTQVGFHLSANNNKIKPIVEIDLFAESPPQQEEDHAADSNELNSNSQISKYIEENKKETFMFSLNMETNASEQQIIKRKLKQSFQLSPSIEIQETATTVHDMINDELTGNDIRFRELCKKYLNPEPAHATSMKLQKTNFGKSFSQILPPLQAPEKCNNFTNFTMDLDVTVDKNVNFKRKSLSFTDNTRIKMGANENNTTFSKSQSFNNNKSNANVDLTQNDGDSVEIADEEDDDCLVLSDDEINYSIWQANKTEHFQTSKQSVHDDDIVSVSDNEVASDEHLDNIIEFPYQRDNNKEFSYLDLKDKEKSLTKIGLGAEESFRDFEILTSKYTARKSAANTEPKFDRSEFGILEEYSEPLDYTPNFFTPTNVLTEASFISSPTEITAPMKHYSICRGSSQKFQDLINNIEAISPPSAADNFNDFDELGHLVYASPLKSSKSNKKPQGLDQLLTAEISFRESQRAPEATMNISSKALAATTQEIKCNDKIYTVRYTYSPKPDYTKYTEAELLKELYNFGIKPLKRKQAVKMLEYIYNQTHPILVEEQEDKLEKQEYNVILLDDFERPCTSKEALRANMSKPCSNVPNESDGTSKKLNLQDSCGLEMLRYAIDLKPELSDENYILQTNVSKKTPQPLLAFHIAWYNLVCSNQKLHETILMYEPIDLHEIYLFLKTLGYRYDPKDLKMFFDRRCIIFRYDLSNPAACNGITKDTNRHEHKSRKNKIIKI